MENFMEHRPYFDVLYQPGEVPTFCYRSGLLVYEEQLKDGVLTAAGYNAAGYPLDVLSGCPSRIVPEKFAEPSAFRLEMDGVSLDGGWQLVDFVTEKGEDALKAVLTLESRMMPLRLRVVTVLDGTQMFTRWLEVENRGAAAKLSRLCLLSGGMETMTRPHCDLDNRPEELYRLGYFDDVNWGCEGQFAWHALQPGRFSVDTRFGRQRYRHPVFFLQNRVLGTTWFCQLGWSGGCRFTADLDAVMQNRESLLSFEAEILGYKPLLILKSGEIWTSPEVHMGAVAGGLDDAVNEMHAHVRKSVLNLPEADGSACLVGAGMGAEHDMSVETSKRFIRQFAEMGAEIFIIDAGWSSPPGKQMQWWAFNGINTPNADRYPKGIAELSDYCHEMGMKFAMWIEIERMGDASPLRHAHPEWYAADIYGKSWESTGYLNFANPEAAAWAEEELGRMIEEFRLDLLRVDYNVQPIEYFGRQNTPDGSECTVLRHFEGVYRMYRNLKKRFPHVIFENCAGGGGRTDLGMMKNFHHTWVSDWQNAPRAQLITNGMTMALPPERVDRLFAGMGSHQFGGLDVQMRNTMLGHMSLNVIAPAVTDANPVAMEFVQHSVAIYKNFIRTFLPTAKIYHHNPEAAAEFDACALEIASQDKKKGAMVVYRLQKGGDALIVHPKGVDFGKKYKVTLDNRRESAEISGAALLNEGLRVVLPTTLSSELVLWEEV